MPLNSGSTRMGERLFGGFGDLLFFHGIDSLAAGDATQVVSKPVVCVGHPLDVAGQCGVGVLRSGQRRRRLPGS